MEFDFLTLHLHFMAYSMQEVRFMLQSCAHCQFGCLLPDEAKVHLSVLHSRYRLIALIAMTVIIQSVGEMFAFSDELSKIARGIIYAVAQLFLLLNRLGSTSTGSSR